MKSFFLKRIISLIPTILGITIIAFMLPRLIPGDPVLILLGDRGGDRELYQEYRSKLGLDRPVIEQYGSFIFKLIKGDFGDSVVSHQSVMSEFKVHFPATLELSLLALFWAILLGIPLGVYAALKKGSYWDFSIMTTSVFGYSIPVFWWGLILIMLFSVTLGWTPVSGRISVMYDLNEYTGLYLIDSWFSDEKFDSFLSTLKHLILPSLTLGTIPLAVITRMTRASLIDVLGEDYIRTAKAKGLSQKKVLFKHALKNAFVPILTSIGLMMGTLVSGALLTESIFSWPGIGRWLVSGVQANDYPVIQSGILLISMMVILINFLIEILYGVFNPKMREI